MHSCHHATKNTFRQYPTSEQYVIEALVNLKNYLNSWEGSSNEDRVYTEWTQKDSPLQVNLIASHVMNSLRD